MEEAVQPENDVGQVRTSYNLEASYNGQKTYMSIESPLEFFCI